MVEASLCGTRATTWKLPAVLEDSVAVARPDEVVRTISQVPFSNAGSVAPPGTHPETVKVTEVPSATTPLPVETVAWKRMLPPTSACAGVAVSTMV